jgi:hypothetical protein
MFVSGTSDRTDVAPHPRLRAALIDWQRGPRAGTLLDARRLSISEDLRPWSGIAEVGEDKRTFTYRFIGDAACAAFGQDFTSRPVHELEPPEYAAIVARQYTEAVTARRPLIHAVWSSDAPSDVYYRLTVPMSDGGARVTQLWLVVANLRRFFSTWPSRAGELDEMLFGD